MTRTRNKASRRVCALCDSIWFRVFMLPRINILYASAPLDHRLVAHSRYRLGLFVEYSFQKTVKDRERRREHLRCYCDENTNLNYIFKLEKLSNVILARIWRYRHVFGKCTNRSEKEEISNHRCQIWLASAQTHGERGRGQIVVRS